MPLPHSLTCPCLRCSTRRKRAAPTIGVGGFSIAAPRRPVEHDGFSTAPAPAPRGPDGPEAVAWARERRAAARAAEREER